MNRVQSMSGNDITCNVKGGSGSIKTNALDEKMHERIESWMIKCRHWTVSLKRNCDSNWYSYVAEKYEAQ